MDDARLTLQGFLKRARWSIFRQRLESLAAVRLAGRGDIDRLARQLRRSEDKLELVLQAVERLEPFPVADD